MNTGLLGRSFNRAKCFSAVYFPSDGALIYHIRSLLLIAILAGSFLLSSFSFVTAASTHLDKARNKKGCSECHKGHGKNNTKMLSHQGDELCMTCHGQFSKGASESTRNDIYSAIIKESSHMLTQALNYAANGNIPLSVSVEPQKQVLCKDCHNVHKSEKGNALHSVAGYRKTPTSGLISVREYEICYKCHSGYTGARGSLLDVSADFGASNPSYHPIETYARSSYVPSLKAGYTVSSIISCSDCHGNDDPSGPSGPHGSIYRPILKSQYARPQSPENPYAYELCYRCHNRSSILNDESFKAHKVHIVYNQASCSVCHTAHGSRYYRSLIRFDTALVFPDSMGNMSFMSMVQGKPRCYLTCHINGRQYEHKMDNRLLYIVNDRTILQW